MTEFPSFEALHPAVVHFPIGLLLVAPVFLILGFLWKKQRSALWLGALILILLGAVGTQSAVVTGEGTYDAVKKIYTFSPEAHEAMEEHEELGELTRTVFVVLALLFLGGAIFWANQHHWLRRPLSPRVSLVAMGIFTAVYIGACLLLFRTAAHGGELVHKYGIRAPLDVSRSPASPGR